MLETEIKKLRETIESLQSVLVSMAAGTPVSTAPVQEEELPPGPDIEELKARTVEAEKRMQERVASRNEAPSAPAPSAPAPTGALTEMQAYATNLVARYSALSGSPETTMGIVAQYGITNIATASDEVLAPFITAMKAALGE